jgi:hypothetical protein
MEYPPQSESAGNVIPLDAWMFDRSDRPQIENAIRKIVRNVRFEILEQERAVRLLGPDMPYHAIDPELPAALERFDPGMTVDDILWYRSSGDLFDLCFEDSWSGYFIADRLGRSAQNGDLVIIHLDDHTDMMSTLLECSQAGDLVDPTTGRPFDPKSPADWVTAIRSGAIGIGCFITPFFFDYRRTHVRHLNNDAAPARSCGVVREPLSYELIPGKWFAAIRLIDGDETAAAGSCVVSSRCEDVLDAMPKGRVIVHVDLDYLINDFNGNPTEVPYIPTPALIEEGRRKLDNFFEALQARRVSVDRWIIATSPGFCSACHWAWLLNAFAEKIQGYHDAHWSCEGRSIHFH